VEVRAAATIRSIRLITVFVGDLDRAVDFYVDRLGLEKRDDTEWGAGFRAVEVAPPESETSIVLVRPSFEMMGAGVAAWAHEHVGAPTGIVLETGDIEAAQHSLTARGVHFLEPPAPRSWGGCAARFVDPDHNIFLLVQPDSAS
jgi:catechol 2,3-dioxygenase-like lactoylglutathione lyase family enzyme